MDKDTKEKLDSFFKEKNPSYNLPKNRLKSIPIRTTLSIGLIIFLFYALFSGMTIQFYASFTFLFYSWIGEMWLSVIALGVFQTILMIPIRAINLRISANVKEFEERLEKLKNQDDAYLIFKKRFIKGDTSLLFYSIDFLIAVIAFFSLGKLFLTDFYNTQLDPKLLYSFTPYPKYPIQGRIFSIPYIWFTKTIDFGMQNVWFAWKMIILFMVVVGIVRFFYVRRFDKKDNQAIITFKNFIKFLNGSYILIFFISWYLVRHFPNAWQIKIFSGDVAFQNTRFNMVTAVATFITILWLDVPKIIKKSELAIHEGISEVIVNQTQIEMFFNSFKNALILGLGAFFITNQIPCAFELSVFTLEIISWISPLTLDRLIFMGVKGKGPVVKKA